MVRFILPGELIGKGGARGQGMTGELICLGEFVKANWQGDCPGDLQGDFDCQGAQGPKEVRA